MEQQAADTMPGQRSYGFLTAVESAAHGIFGGYLLVDPLGRPLEFHCTAPVKVSRAQQILYGAALKPQLQGQQIGGALLAEGTVVPAVVLTDLEPMLHARGQTKLPVALVRGTVPGGEAAGTEASFPSGGGFSLGHASVSPHPQDAGRSEELREMLAELAAAVDLREPFERIRAAIEEAQKH